MLTTSGEQCTSPRRTWYCWLASRLELDEILLDIFLSNFQLFESIECDSVASTCSSGCNGSVFIGIIGDGLSRVAGKDVFSDQSKILISGLS